MNLDLFSRSYLNSLMVYAKENSPIDQGSTVEVYDADGKVQAYGRVLQLAWNSFEATWYASVMLYGGSVCTLPTFRMSQVKWNYPISKGLFHSVPKH